MVAAVRNGIFMKLSSKIQYYNLLYDFNPKPSFGAAFLCSTKQAELPLAVLL